MRCASVTRRVAWRDPHPGWNPTRDTSVRVQGRRSLPDCDGSSAIPRLGRATSSGNCTYDRSGRIDVEHYCVEPAAPDPLASYFNLGAFITGGLYTMQPLSTTAFIAETELNEWRRLSPGHCRVYAISYRVSRRSNPGEPAPYGVVDEVIRSSPAELDVASAVSSSLAGVPHWRPPAPRVQYGAGRPASSSTNAVCRPERGVSGPRHSSDRRYAVGVALAADKSGDPPSALTAAGGTRYRARAGEQSPVRIVQTLVGHGRTRV